MAPPVAPTPQVRRPTAAVGRQRRRNLRDALPAERRLDDHLGRELHPRAAERQRLGCVAPEAAQPAVEVAHRRAEEEPTERAQHRVAEQAVQPRHRARRDAAGEAIADDEIVARAQPFDECVQVREVVAAVGVAHDHIATARGRDPTAQRAAVAARGDVHDPRARPGGELGRAVRTAVVRDEHLTRDGCALEERDPCAHAARDRLGLVQTRHQDRQLEVGARVDCVRRACRGLAHPRNPRSGPACCAASMPLHAGSVTQPRGFPKPGRSLGPPETHRTPPVGRSSARRAARRAAEAQLSGPGGTPRARGSPTPFIGPPTFRADGYAASPARLAGPAETNVGRKSSAAAVVP